MALLSGVLYTAAVTVVAQGLFERQADGSLLVVGDVIVGSELVGQTFTSARYFHPRPSAVSYDPSLSGGSNLGPNNPDLSASVAERASQYREENDLGPDTPVPVDAVTSSGSGLDPHISLANARLQAPRVAEARGVPLERVLSLIAEQQDATPWPSLSEPSVNVLLLNIALDDL